MDSQQGGSAPKAERTGNGKSFDGKGTSAKGFFTGSGKKLRDRVEEEATEEALSAFRSWRQKISNGVLPIGIANVGKTTFLTKFANNNPNLFLEFNRTHSTSMDSRRLRDDLLKRCKGTEFYRGIDVPGDLPMEWARAYFKASPRVLVVLVDDRPAAEHTKKLGEFLSALKLGPTKWERVRTWVTFNTNNLAGILFVMNKVDKFAADAPEPELTDYKNFLSDLASLLPVPICTYKMSLTEDRESELLVFAGVVDLFGKK
ncbi:hypothetical protein MIZ03_1474 [Rhodoferax lithotrophicus]|uniref:G domain-containing protein n=1 Tax=Rhodoferax lithotrophicus TaxID=2798804 RepID=A0ABN6D3N7_9BURK|nr:hypothetical protein [Rhodoferax sp. MIZ03]BCO26591.1 hypothetical protein MIZ03_1474 [Rhodoferax sp. MIZ03]